MLASDWVALAKELEISDSDINIIKTQYPDNTPQQAIVMLRLWMQTSGNKATGNTLEKALRAIHRDDIVNECICNMEIVTDVSEKATAEEVLVEKKPQSNLVEEITPPYDEKDIMKDAESVEEEEIAHKTMTERQKEKDETYEAEERKYAAEEKIVKEIEDNLLRKEKYPVKEEEILSKDEKHSPKTEEKYPKEEKKLPKEEKKSPKDDKKPPKDDKKGPTDDTNYIKEEIISKKEKIISEIKSEETIKKKGNEIEIEKKEESMKETKEERKEEKREKSQEKKIFEVKEEEKEVLEEKKVEERQLYSKVPQDEQPKQPTTTVTTTQHTTSEDGTVTEHIRVETRTTIATEVPKPGKEEFLQKLGEELGKLDEKLEEKFKEKNKQKIADGLTQPSAETSQMESGQTAPSDVKPPTASVADQPTSDLQLSEREIGETKSTPDDSSKPEDIIEPLEKEKDSCTPIGKDPQKKEEKK